MPAGNSLTHLPGRKRAIPSPADTRLKAQLHPVLRANPFPEVTDLICRLPSSILFHPTRGYKPWRPDAVYGTDIGQITTSLRFSKTTETSSDIPRKGCYSSHYAFSPGHLISRQLRISSGDNAFREFPLCL
jgi:hypothetical protein